MVRRFIAAATLAALAASAAAADQSGYLRDRGDGVATSLFGTYIESGQWLLYPFYEYEKTSGYEYQGRELGLSNDATDYLGRYQLNEALLFVAYGLSRDLALEFETAVHEDATLRRAPGDTTSGMPPRMRESGWGETEANLRWRLMHESDGRPELFTYLNVDIPLQRSRHLIGTADWASEVGVGLVKGFGFGTLTPRIGFAYDGADRKFELGEWAIEYLRRASDHWRWVAALEGASDEVSAIGELQWRLGPHAMVKFNSGFGLTRKAPDIAPEIGVIFTR